MNNHKNHMIHLAKALWSYQTRKTKCNYLPSRLWLEPSSLCNLRCGICPNKSLPNKDKGNMEFSLFKRIVDEASSFAYDIYLFHRGEPFVNPMLFEMIRYIKARGMRVCLHSNATLLSKEKSEELLTTGLDFISFSFDGYDKEKYEQARIGADFDITLKNILDFLNLKKIRSQNYPFTVLQVMELGNVPSKMLESKKRPFLQNFQNLPLDKIIIREPHNWGGSIGLSKDKMLMNGNGRHYTPCPFLWYSQTILWDGSILPCCQDFMGDFKLGKVGSMNLLDAWNNPDMVTLRENIVDEKSKKNGPCSICDKLYRKTFLRIPIDYLDSFLETNLSGFNRLRRTLVRVK